MKTVGIVTTFRQENFGSVLQAYALQYVICEAGNDVKVIDYIYPNEYHYSRGLKKRQLSLKTKLKIFVKDIFRFLGLMPPKKMWLLNDFIKKEIHCTEVYNNYSQLHKKVPKFDVYISGSDQIWNPKTMVGDMSYMLDFAPEGALLMSYSSSFSCDSIPIEYKEEYKKNLLRFKVIAVREANGLKLVEEITGRNDAKLVLDPTLLLNKHQWDILADQAQKIKIPEKYILCYKLAYTYNPDKKMNELLDKVQKQHGLPIVTLSYLPGWCGGEMICLSEDKYRVGIYEFLDLFRKASIVVTSSFHGTAFALNFGRPFLALSESIGQSDDRISSLLNMVGLSSHLVTADAPIPNIINPDYDVDKEQISLDNFRKISKNILLEYMA